MALRFEIGSRWRFRGGLELLISPGDIVTVQRLQHNGIIVELEGSGAGWSCRLRDRELLEYFEAVPAKAGITKTLPTPEGRYRYVGGEMATSPDEVWWMAGRDVVTRRARMCSSKGLDVRVDPDDFDRNFEPVAKDVPLFAPASKGFEEFNSAIEACNKAMTAAILGNSTTKSIPVDKDAEILRLKTELVSREAELKVIRSAYVDVPPETQFTQGDGVAYALQLARLQAENAELRALLEKLEPIARRLGLDAREGR